MSKITTKKFTKLQKELDYWQSELEYVQEVLIEEHFKFEEYHRKYCKDNEIDLNKLNEENNKRIKQLIPKPVKKRIQFKDKIDEKYIKKVYKQLARKLHPDVGGDEEAFKDLVSAMEEKKINKILDICSKHDIIIEMSEELNKILEKQIKSIKQQINKEKSTYSWKMHLCGGNKLCKNVSVQKFLKQLFNYEGKK